MERQSLSDETEGLSSMGLKFDLSEILQDGERTAFEPRVPDTVGSESFVFVPTTGMRVAPEVLIVELFREIFFDPISNGQEAQLSPDAQGLDSTEGVILRLARGRLKLTRHGGAEGYFTPVFPEQARVAWLRKKSDRTLRLLLLEGAMAQGLAYSASDSVIQTAERIVKALAGSQRAPSKDQVRDKEILSAAVAGVAFDHGQVGLMEHGDAAKRLVEYFDSAKTAPEKRLPADDPLARRICDDFVALCALEGVLPRLLWLELLKCYLRLAVPTWLLAHARMASLLRDWILKAIETGHVTSNAEVKQAIASRHVQLFHPTTTGTNELAGHVDRYMKARVELSLLLYLLRSKVDARLFESVLSVESAGNERVTVEELLTKFAQLGIASDGAGPELRQSLIRSFETFAAWTNPIRRGQGKNIDEFLRVLRTFKPRADDSGYLADGETREQAVVFPGPTMIRLVLLLTEFSKHKNGAAANHGKLVLAELEKHFADYGLDFSSSSGARPRLISELARLALLKGSPDAGDYTELLVPISGTEKAVQEGVSRARGSNP